MEAHIEPLRSSPTPEIAELVSGSDEAGDPPSSPPQVEVQAGTGTLTEPLDASPMTEMPEPTTAHESLIDLLCPIRPRGQILCATP